MSNMYTGVCLRLYERRRWMNFKYKLASEAVLPQCTTHVQHTPWAIQSLSYYLCLTHYTAVPLYLPTYSVVVSLVAWLAR